MSVAINNEIDWFAINTNY